MRYRYLPSSSWRMYWTSVAPMTEYVRFLPSSAVVTASSGVRFFLIAFLLVAAAASLQIGMSDFFLRDVLSPSCDSRSFRNDLAEDVADELPVLRLQAVVTLRCARPRLRIERKNLHEVRISLRDELRDVAEVCAGTAEVGRVASRYEVGFHLLPIESAFTR